MTEFPGGGDAAAIADEVRVRRGVNRATYDREVVHAIIDATLVAHVGTVRDGKPVVIPMFAARDGETLLLHGAPASGVIRRATGVDVCVTITLVDGIVLARSAFHHSVNYRSVAIIGEATEVTDPTEKARALDLFVERLTPGRTGLRPMTDKEIQGTTVLRIPLDKVSAKVRAGDPVDDDEDYALPIWAGVVPVTTTMGTAVGDTRLLDGVAVPDAVSALAGTVR